MSEELMKRGMWTVTLLHVDKNHGRMDKYHVGIFETAQEAFAEGNNYLINNWLEENTMDQPLPESMVVELQGFGLYPDNIELQLPFTYIEGAMGAPYMDVHGVTRGSYLARREAGE